MTFFSSILNSLRKHWPEGLIIVSVFLFLAVYFVLNPTRFLGFSHTGTVVVKPHLMALKYEPTKSPKLKVINADEIEAMFKLWDEARFGVPPSHETKENEKIKNEY